MPEFRLPSDTQRLAIIGRTGSGKTQAAAWHLSMRSFDTMPWVAFNFKGDDLLQSIPGKVDLELKSAIPNKPGLYHIEVSPDEKEEADAFLMRAWERQNVGLYIDEGYMLTGLPGFRRCLTQGRSRHIPMIVLSQRPVWMDKFTWSEADYFQLFKLKLETDQDIAKQYVGDAAYMSLPKYHSVWHDVVEDATFRLQPVPDRDTLLQTFRDRLGVKRRVIA